MNLDIILDLNIIHALRRNKHKLSRDRPSRRLNHHPHTDIAIDLIHENIEFVKATDGTTHGFPKGEQ
jgi:hypothetical protein